MFPCTTDTATASSALTHVTGVLDKQQMTTGDDLVAAYEGIPFMTSAGPVRAKSLKGAHIG